MNKTLITGVTGLLGGNLARLMHQTGGYDLRVLVRESSDNQAIHGLDLEVVYGDIRDKAAVDNAMIGCKTVIHCAASVSQWKRNRPMMFDVNVKGTEHVLQSALDAGVERAVYVSTVDTLGLSSRGNPADETWEHESMAAFNSPYVDTKYEAEQRALAINKKGLDTVIVKPTYMIGEWDVKPTSGQMIVEVAKGRVKACPGGGNNFVDVLDVARGIILALEKGKNGESYILANKDGNLTYREFMTKTAKIVGVKPPAFVIPYPVALAAGYLFDAVGTVFGLEPDVNSVTARMGYAPHYFTPEKAIRELGIPQSPIDDAIKRAYDWFVRKGML